MIRYKTSTNAVAIYRKKFSFDNPELPKVSLWNMAPIWPSRPKSKITYSKIKSFVSKAASHSSASSHLILWIPTTELCQNELDFVNICYGWVPQCTILSGGDLMSIGYVYARGSSPIKFDTKSIFDSRKARGSSSSKTMLFLLKELAMNELGKPKDGAYVVDMFAHKSAILPSLCRRLGIPYAGFTASKKSYSKIRDRLSQMEIPGVRKFERESQ